jgi:hypothetical protein
MLFSFLMMRCYKEDSQENYQNRKTYAETSHKTIQEAISSIATHIVGWRWRVLWWITHDGFLHS